MEQRDRDPAAKTPPEREVAPGPHLHAPGVTTRRVMIDVLCGLLPVAVAAALVFRGAAIFQLTLCIAACLAAEALFALPRRKPIPLKDGSAAVTGAILAFSLPATAPWYVGVLGAFVAVGLGKALYGGLGQNLFNPAMVGRAFVMIAFPAALGASAYVQDASPVQVLTQATPMTLLKQTGQATPLAALLWGYTNGSLGETSAVACLAGGLFLCFRRAASWRIPAATLAAVALIGGLGQLLDPGSEWTVLHDLLGGALLFGAFFIATDPVTSPLTPRGQWIFGSALGALVLLLRRFSGYPEGVMFAVLLMNAVVPLINRWCVPRPVGGPARRN